MAKPDQASFVKILNFYDQLKHAFRDREEKVLDLYEKCLGNMWNAEDKALLIDQKRPVTEYNLLEPLRNAYVGTERLSRMNMRAVPYKGGSNATAQLLTTAMYWNYNKAWYDWHKSKQFMHTIVGGIGWGHDYWDFQRGHWTFKSFDALRIRWDTFTQSADFSDCRYLQDTQWLTAEELATLCQDPQTKKDLLYALSFYEPKKLSNVFYQKHAEGYSWHDIRTPKADEDFADLANGRYRIVDHHEKRDVVDIFFVNPDNGNILNLSGKEDEELQAFSGKYPDHERFDVPRTEFWQTMIVPVVQMIIRDEIYPLENPRFFAYKPQVAYDIKPYIIDVDSVFTSPAKINDAFNKRKSVELEYAIDTVGGEYLIEEGAIDGYEAQWNTRRKRAYKMFKKDFNKPERSTPGQVPATLFQVANEDLQLFDIISGVGRNYRGMKESANETGVLADTKIKQTEVMLQHVFDNAVLSQYMDAYSCIQHIKQFMDEQQLANLSDVENGMMVNPEAIQAIKGDTDYEIEIDTAKPSATARQYGFSQIVQLLQYLPPDMLRLDLVIEASDIPNKGEMADFIRARYKAMGIDVNNLDNSNPASIGAMMGSPAVSQAGVTSGARKQVIQQAVGG